MHKDRPSTGDHDRDVHGLRMALGSILNPKRSVSSRTSSGTASPNPAHFGPGLVHPYPYSPQPQDGHSHAHTPHIPSHLHTPHDFESHETKDMSSSPPTSSDLRPSLSYSRSHSQSSFDSEASSGSDHESGNHSASPILTTSNVHGMTTAEAEARVKKIKDEKRRKNAEEKEQKEKVAAYLATLQSKRAWDVLVHGNM
ncbi:hypothetical protein SCHPADRAFT_909553, partial [Schizopora paradoxa]